MFPQTKLLYVIYICITRGKITTFGSKMVIFPARNANTVYTILGRISQGYIFLILQQFATELCIFIHFKMFFPAMVMGFVLLVLIKISSFAGITINSNPRFRVEHRIRTSD